MGKLDEKKKQNEATLSNIDVKQEINLDNKVDNRHTLAEILDVPAGSNLRYLHLGYREEGRDGEGNILSVF